MYAADGLDWLANDWFSSALHLQPKRPEIWPFWDNSRTNPFFIVSVIPNCFGNQPADHATDRCPNSKPLRGSDDSIGLVTLPAQSIVQRRHSRVLGYSQIILLLIFHRVRPWKNSENLLILGKDMDSTMWGFFETQCICGKGRLTIL